MAEAFATWCIFFSHSSCHTLHIFFYLSSASLFFFCFIPHPFSYFCCVAVLDFSKIQRAEREKKEQKSLTYTRHTWSIYNLPSSTINEGIYAHREIKKTREREKKWKKLFHKANNNNNTHTSEKEEKKKKEKKMRKTTSTASLIHQVLPSILAGGFSLCPSTIFLFSTENAFSCRSFSCSCCCHHSQVARYIANLLRCATDDTGCRWTFFLLFSYSSVLCLSLSLDLLARALICLVPFFSLYFCHPALVRIAPFQLRNELLISIDINKRTLE